MARTVRIVKSSIPGPFNILDLPDQSEIEFIATGYAIGEAEREIEEGGSKTIIKGKIMRVYTDLRTPVFGAPFVDILAGRTIALLESIFSNVGFPLKLKIKASGKEPQKWYEITFEQLSS